MLHLLAQRRSLNITCSWMLGRARGGVLRLSQYCCMVPHIEDSSHYPAVISAQGGTVSLAICHIQTLLTTCHFSNKVLHKLHSSTQRWPGRKIKLDYRSQWPPYDPPLEPEQCISGRVLGILCASSDLTLHHRLKAVKPVRILLVLQVQLLQDNFKVLPLQPLPFWGIKFETMLFYKHCGGKA